MGGGQPSCRTGWDCRRPRSMADSNTTIFTMLESDFGLDGSTGWENVGLRTARPSGARLAGRPLPDHDVVGPHGLPPVAPLGRCPAIYLLNRRPGPVPVHLAEPSDDALVGRG